MLQVGSSQCIGRLASINWAIKHWCHGISHTATWQWIVRVIAGNSNKCETELSHNNKKHYQTFSHRNQRYTKHINKTMRFKTKITSFSYIFVVTNQDALTIHKLKWKAPYPIALFPFINTIVIILPQNATLLGKDDNFRKFYFYFKKIYWQKDPFLSPSCNACNLEE